MLCHTIELPVIGIAKLFLSNACTFTSTGVECPAISDSSNDHMSVSVNSTYVDSTATYTCSSGYEIVGSATRTCEATGTWGGSQPSCSGE